MISLRWKSGLHTVTMILIEIEQGMEYNESRTRSTGFEEEVTAHASFI